MMASPLTDVERKQILLAARQAIRGALSGHPSDRPEAAGVFGRRAGAFVSLHNHGELRGCIGHPEGDQPLSDVIGRCAVAAARDDPRFPAVVLDELDEVDIEVSVLGEIQPVSTPEDIEIGKHGLIAEHGRRRGLLLPQVATEQRWNRETFIRQTCLKAGLAPDEWKRGARLFRFEAEVFGDKHEA
jgi:AmmeMemoRadiSam system protein A